MVMGVTKRAPTTTHHHRHLLLLLLSLISLSSRPGKLTLSPAAALAASTSSSSSPFVGINIGTDVSNLLAPAALASFLTSQRITHVRLYDADPALLTALSAANVSVLIGIPNTQLLAFGSSPATAAAWVARHVLPFLPSISAVAIGDEVPTAVPSSLPLLLPALGLLSSALAAANCSSIPVSTPLPSSLLLNPFPPSQSFFNQSLVPSLVLPLLQFLSNTSAPLMLNLYPYYSFVQSRGVVPLPAALFKPVPADSMVDPNTLLHYTNVLDAMVDAAHFAMRNLNFTNVPLLVTESGWPSAGGPSEPSATKDNAETYNSNLIKHVLSRSGTPLHPEFTSSVYIYELFNEDLRPGPLSEANWGLFYGNGTPVYLLRVAGSGGFLANDTESQTYCVAADGADAQTLQAALDWACGAGRANCSEIQPGEDCYNPNNVKSHASYAFNRYYQTAGRAARSCDFQGAATVTTTDPSHGNCIFPGSKEITNSTIPGTNSTRTSSAKRTGSWMTRKGKEQGLSFLFPTVLQLLVVVVLSTCTPWI